MTLANRYRPNFFSEVIGQDNAVNALRNIIKKETFHNGYIFSGTRGVGKTTLGRLFAKSLNCTNYNSEKGDACGVCAVCKEVQNNAHLDLIEIDAASRTGVDDMRDLLESVQYRPSSGKYKIYLIDEVHMLSIQSFNALLKTLEEPPPHVIFIMATTESHKIPKTIISRCLQFNLRLVSDDVIAENLSRIFQNEKVSADQRSTDLIVELAKGSVRDSLTLADQAISHCDGNLTESEVSKLHGVLDISSTSKLFELILSDSAEEVIVELERYRSLDVNYEILFARALKFLHEQIINTVKESSGLNQDMNLFYQFFSNGLVDAKQTDSWRENFDIAALRCLSFKKKDNKEIKKNDSLDTSSTTKPVNGNHIEEEEISHETKSVGQGLVKLTTENWLNIFDDLDLEGQSRALFANLQLKKVEEKKVIFHGSNIFTDNINENHLDDLKLSLKNIGYDVEQVEIKEETEIKNTPSSEWQKKRKQAIEDFKRDVLSSSLVINLNESFNANIDESKVNVIDHEE